MSAAAQPAAIVPLARSLSDLRWRVNELQSEFRSCLHDARFTLQGGSLHWSQLEALEVMMATLMQKRVEPPLASLENSAGSPEQFLTALQGLCNVWQVWDVFRIAFARRSGTDQQMLQVGDGLAVDCYVKSLDLAKHSIRPAPPLVHVMPRPMPEAIHTDASIGHLGLRVLTSQNVPVPIAVVPTDHLKGVWLFSFQYHEVGHFIDRELAISEAVANRLLARSDAASSMSAWVPWVRELVGDTFGVLFGGPAFGLALMDLLRCVGPALPVDSENKYPPYWLRMSVVAELVAKLAGSIWPDDAQRVARLVLDPPPGDANARLKADAVKIAADCLEACVPSAGDLPVQKLAPRLTDDWKGVRQLANHLVRKSDPRPAAGDLPLRLIPAAAVLALFEAGADRTRIQHEALAFATARPSFGLMGGLESGHTGPVDLYRKLAREMTFD